MKALVFGEKNRALFNLCAFGLLGPFLTFLPLTLVFYESASSGLYLTAAAFSSLFLTLAYGWVGLSLSAMIFALTIGFCHIETLSTWTLWSALTSGTLVTYFGSSELVEALEEKPTQVIASDPHRAATLQKLLQLTRYQLKHTQTDLVNYKGKIVTLEDRVKVAEGLFEEQNAQIAALFEKVKAAESMRAELDQLSLSDQGLLKKATTCDLLFEQLHAKGEVLAETRRSEVMAQLEVESLERALIERVPESLVERLQSQLVHALGRLEKARQEQKELFEIVSLWSKST